MIVEDKVYGREEIKEEVLLELIDSKAIQRLKGISQFGMPDEYYHKNGFSRYDHSIGVLILLRRMKAPIKEQIAGLLHDVSHTAFSHVVDWVVGDPTKEDYQDKALMKVIEKSEIPNILQKYCFDYKEVASIERFSLLEREIPFLCADRVDYSLREIILFNDKDKVDIILNDLFNFSGKMAFKDEKIAEMFAKMYTFCQEEHWASKEARARYYILGGLLRKAISKRFISFEDLWKTDYEVIDLLKKSDDEEIAKSLGLLKEGFRIEEYEGEGSFQLKKKFRYVDPEVLVGNRLIKLSEISESYRENLEIQKKKSNLDEFFRIVAR